MAKTKVYVEFDHITTKHYSVPIIVVHSGVVPTAQDINRTWNNCSCMEITENATLQGAPDITDQMTNAYIPEGVREIKLD